MVKPRDNDMYLIYLQLILSFSAEQHDFAPNHDPFRLSSG